MKARERVLITLNHKEPDRVPIDIGGTSCSTLIEPVYQKLLKRYRLEDIHNKIINPAMRSVSISKEVKEFLHSDTDILCVNEPSSGRITVTKDGFIDEWGVRYRQSRVGNDFYYDISEHPLANAEIDDLKTYSWPNPNDSDRYSGLKKKLKN